LRLLLDERYSPEIARQLRSRGHDVVAVGDRPELIGSSDEQLFTLMADEGRAIVTNNAPDFVPLARRAAVACENHLGLLLTDDRSLPRSAKTIGAFVRGLERFLSTRPSVDAYRDRIGWLT
jgi:hypothetical protein